MLQKIFRDIVDKAIEGIIVIDDQYRIVYMNHVALQITGFAREEIMDKFCYEILRAHRCKSACPIKALKKGRDLGEIIVDIITRDNKEKYIRAKVVSTQGYWVEMCRDVTREIELEKRVKEKYILGDIITRDRYLLTLLKEFPKIAASRVPVLFAGESGVGKEVFSSAMQSLSNRRDRPFVKINCASLPDTLLESELFGYKKGAFTDARKDKPGLFNAADRGTLLLDEIGEMSLPLQAKLLRAVETGEIIPLGAVEAERVDVRLLAASNKDLNVEVAKKKFREDLYYRLNVVTIKIPPLRERREDIPLLIDYFINHFNIIQEKEVVSMSPETLEILLNHPYPGNIRELRNIMEYVFIFCHRGEIQHPHLPAYLRPDSRNDAAGNGPPHIPAEAGAGPAQLIAAQGEKEHILEALNRARWNKSKAAGLLGIDRTTLWRKLKKYGIDDR